MATSAYLKVDGADGESTDEKHKNWIDVETWSWSAVQPQSTATGMGMGQARVSLSPLMVTGRVNKGSNALFLYCCNGKHIPKVVLEQTKAGESQQVEFHLLLNLGPGSYAITFGLHDRDDYTNDVQDWWNNSLAFEVDYAGDMDFVGVCPLPVQGVHVRSG